MAPARALAPWWQDARSRPTAQAPPLTAAPRLPPSAAAARSLHQHGASCGTVSPKSRCECCTIKAGEGKADDWCLAHFIDDCPQPGPSCGDAADQCGCCRKKAINDVVDNWCLGHWAQQCGNGGKPAPGSSCGSVSPTARCACCADKGAQAKNDAWCAANTARCPAHGSSCGSVSPKWRCDCCERKGGAMKKDSWCKQHFYYQC